MKKSIIVALAFLFVCALSASAQSYSYERGYRGNVGIGYEMFGQRSNMDGQWLLETNHGFSFGNGLYAGAGIGFMKNLASDVKVGLLPIYAEAKYNFINGKISPFVDARLGMTFYVSSESDAEKWNSFMVAPAAGCDFGRFSLAVSYMFLKNKMSQIGITAHFNF